MDAFGVLLKILAAIAVILGAVFVVVTYGDKIMGFFKKLMGCQCGCACDDSDFVDESDLEDDEIIAVDQDFEG